MTRRSGVRMGWAGAMLGGLLLATSAAAVDLSSENFLVIGSNFNGGGAARLTPAVPGSGIGSLGSSIGQSEALGFSGSTDPSSLMTAVPGFWPIVAGAFPTLDIDGDGFQAFLDNCPFALNPLQEDISGVGAGSLPDGIGDACQCGDVDDDGVVDGFDVDTFRDAPADPITLALPAAGQTKCTVIGQLRDCDVLDVTVLWRVIDGPALPPDIAQVCEAAVAP
ncbi:MAG: thrombospondin type 3 repeat-containing protein [Myxococcota bacterium]